MEQNQLEQTRAGLVNFIGALISVSPFEEKNARHDVSAILIEEALKLSQEKDSYDLFVLKPLLRGLLVVLNNRLEKYENTNDKIPENLLQQLQDTREKYRNCIFVINQLLESI